MYRRLVYCVRLVRFLENSYSQNCLNQTYFNKPFNSISVLSNVNMSQRSITSFFTKTPNKCLVNGVVKKHTSSEKCEVNAEESPKKNETKKRKSIKRQRLESTDSEKSNKSTPSSSPDIKKSSKRQRIESSSSEGSPQKKLPLKVKEEKASPLSKKKTKAETNNESSVKDEKDINIEDNDTGYAIKKEIDNKRSPKKDKKVKTVELTNNIKTEVTKNEKNKENQQTEVEVGGDLKPQVQEVDYNPSKSKYEPIVDACWSHGEPVPYLAFAKTLELIEATSARLKMIEILSNYLRSVILLTPEDLLPSIYLVLNQLAPAYHGLELGIAETSLLRAVGSSTGRTLTQMKASLAAEGDLGVLAMKARTAQRTLTAPPKLKLRKVIEVLREIAQMSGHASMNKKIQKIQNLYISCRHSEAKYLIRGLQGKLRVGLAEQSVLQSMALAFAHTPPQQWPPRTIDRAKDMSAEQFKSLVEEYSLIIKTTYCECPNYEMIIPIILADGVRALPEQCGLTPGIPLKPMLAHPTRGVTDVLTRFENTEFTCEYKYDGERAQIHIPGELGMAKVFSRNQEDNTSKYPDIMGRLPKLLKPTVKSCILDTEAVAFDVTTQQILPFQILSTRKRKDANESDIKVQVCVYVFDLLYLNGESLVKQPLATRRALLKEHFNEVTGEWQFAVSRDCSSVESIQEFLEESVKGSCEGLMVKTLVGKDATYEIARRSHNWLKLKKDYLDGVGDTIDAVVIGAWHGKGKRVGNYGGLLLASYNNDHDQYQSLCKIGTGFTDNDLHTITQRLNEHIIHQPKGYYRYDSSHTPDVWFSAEIVIEVRCADLSLSPTHHAAIGLLQPDKGISLRFPRFIRIRDDKKAEEATSSQQIADMYMAQDQVKNQTNKNTQNTDDFY